MTSPLVKPAHALSENLLQNPGFEDSLSGWTTSVGTAVYTDDPTTSNSGCCSVRGIEINTGSLGTLYQDVTAVTSPEDQYQISGWIKTSDVVTIPTGGGAAIGLSYVVSGGYTPADGGVKSIGFVSGTQDWTFFQSDVFTLPSMPSDASALYFSIDFSVAAGTAWWDNLSLVCVSCAPPGTGSLAITMGGLPSSLSAEVSVTGPGGYSALPTIAGGATDTLTGLTPGTYTVTGGLTVGYQPTQASYSQTVTAGSTTSVTVQYASVCQGTDIMILEITPNQGPNNPENPISITGCGFTPGSDSPDEVTFKGSGPFGLDQTFYCNVEIECTVSSDTVIYLNTPLTFAVGPIEVIIENSNTGVQSSQSCSSDQVPCDEFLFLPPPPSCYELTSVPVPDTTVTLGDNTQLSVELSGNLVPSSGAEVCWSATNAWDPTTYKIDGQGIFELYLDAKVSLTQTSDSTTVGKDSPVAFTPAIPIPGTPLSVAPAYTFSVGLSTAFSVDLYYDATINLGDLSVQVSPSDQLVASLPNPNCASSLLPLGLRGTQDSNCIAHSTPNCNGEDSTKCSLKVSWMAEASVGVELIIGVQPVLDAYVYTGAYLQYQLQCLPCSDSLMGGVKLDAGMTVLTYDLPSVEVQLVQPYTVLPCVFFCDMEISVDSPVNFLITAPDGQQAGFAADGSEITGIPAANLIGPCSPQSEDAVRVGIPSPIPGQYTVTMYPSCADSSGSQFTINVQGPSGSQSYSGTVYQGGAAQDIFATLGSDGGVTISTGPTTSNGVPEFPAGSMLLVALIATVLVGWSAHRRRKLLLSD
jgi:hypothetical protein